ncbi:unnamed protein product [Mortierella alpina]
MVGFKRLDHGVIHYTTKFPWPLSPREYFYELSVHEPKENHFCVSSQTVGKTRATDGTLQNLYSSNNYKSMVTLVPSSMTTSSSSSTLLTVPGTSGAAASTLSLPTPGSHKVFKLPAVNKSVRVEEYRQDVVMVPSEDGKGCHVWFGYFDDPKGHIPSSIVNWATKSGIPGTRTFLSCLCQCTLVRSHLNGLLIASTLGFLKGIQEACLRRAATQRGASSSSPAIRDRPSTPDSGIEA